MSAERCIALRTDEVRKLLRGEAVEIRRPLREDRLRVRLDRRVTSDPIVALIHEPIIADPGVSRAQMNRLGAVSIDVNGRWLGVKPGEFNFECPFGVGKTRCIAWRASGKGRKPWAIMPKITRRWVKESFLWPEQEDIRDLCVYRSDHDNPSAALKDLSQYRDGSTAWTPANRMPRWASRLTVEIAEVRIERTADDAGWEWVAPARRLEVRR